MRYLFIILFCIGIKAQTTPANFHYTDVERTFVVLNWDAVSGVDGYRVYVDGSAVGTTTNTTYAVSGLTALTNYDFAVTSYIGGSESAQSVLPDVLTGLFPDEELLSIDAYSIPSIPSNTTPYTNEFGLTEQKITQRSVEGDVSTISKDYSKMPAWNRDGSVFRTQLPFDQYNGTTYAKLADQLMSNHWGWWPDKRSLNFNENSYRERSDNGATLTTVRTFSEYTNTSIAPTAETQPDITGNRWSFEGMKGSQMYLFTYERSSNTKFGEVAIPDVAEGWTATSWDGQYALVLIQNNGSVSNRLLVYDFETLTLVNTIIANIGHVSIQQSIQGNQVIYGYIGGEIGMYRVDTGAYTNLVGGPSDYPQLGHAGGTNYDQPGWGFVDDRQYDSYASVSGTNAKIKSYRKVYAICLDENKSGVDEVLTRTYGRVYTLDGSGNRISHVSSPDPTGQKVAWNNHNDGNHTYYEVYVAQRITGENTTPPVNGGSVPGSPIASITRKKASTFTGIN
jgi:hypothetical protein